MFKKCSLQPREFFGINKLNLMKASNRASSVMTFRLSVERQTIQYFCEYVEDGFSISIRFVRSQLFETEIGAKTEEDVDCVDKDDGEESNDTVWLSLFFCLRFFF